MSDLLQLLLQDGYLSASEVVALRKTCRQLHETPVRVLRSLDLASPEKIQAYFNKFFGYDAVTDALVEGLDEQIRACLPADLAINFAVFPVEERARALVVAMEDPADPAMRHRLEFFLGRKIVPVVANTYQISRALRRLYGAEPDRVRLSTVLELARGVLGGVRYEPEVAKNSGKNPMSKEQAHSAQQLWQGQDASENATGSGLDELSRHSSAYEKVSSAELGGFAQAALQQELNSVGVSSLEDDDARAQALFDTLKRPGAMEASEEAEASAPKFDDVETNDAEAKEADAGEVAASGMDLSAVPADDFTQPEEALSAASLDSDLSTAALDGDVSEPSLDSVLGTSSLDSELVASAPDGGLSASSLDDDLSAMAMEDAESPAMDDADPLFADPLLDAPEPPLLDSPAPPVPAMSKFREPGPALSAAINAALVSLVLARNSAEAITKAADKLSKTSVTLELSADGLLSLAGPYGQINYDPRAGSVREATPESIVPVFLPLLERISRFLKNASPS